MLLPSYNVLKSFQCFIVVRANLLSFPYSCESVTAWLPSNTFAFRQRQKNSIFWIAALATRLKWQQACSIDWKLNFIEWRWWSCWTFQFSYSSVTYSTKFGGPATQNYSSRKDGLALHVTSFSFSTIPFTINQSQLARENPLSYSVVKNMISFPLCAQGITRILFVYNW